MRCNDCPLFDDYKTDRHYVTLPIPQNMLEFINGEISEYTLAGGYVSTPADYIYDVLVNHLNQLIDARGINPRKSPSLFFKKIRYNDNKIRKTSSLPVSLF